MRELGPDAQNRLERILKNTFFDDPEWYPDGVHSYFDSPEGKRDLYFHVVGRTAIFRNVVIGWINSLLPLAGARILEIGCGTGASTVALAEQGARVTGIDINPQALATARDRLDLYGLQANLILGNACAELPVLAGKGEHEAIIFFAVMEHLTWAERMSSLHAAWDVLKPGQLLFVIEAPNRLWHTDFHTSYDPFFMWLPDQAAMEYSRFTSRKTFNTSFRKTGEDEATRAERLARWGRGVSYHEFEIALDIPAERLPVDGAMWEYHRSAPLKRLAARFAPSYRFSSMLRAAKPNLHPGFYLPTLDLAFRKP